MITCPVCRQAVDPRAAVLDDGGAYHAPCSAIGPICALCAKPVAPGSDTTLFGHSVLHARCTNALGGS